jgi:hypothetical protein
MGGNEMNSTEFVVDDKTYELKLTTKNTVRLERKLNGNVMNMFIKAAEGILPTLEDEITILFYALQANHADRIRNIDDAYDLYDCYVEDGGDALSLMTVLVEVLQDSGIMPKVENNEEPTLKNLQA